MYIIHFTRPTYIYIVRKKDKLICIYIFAMGINDYFHDTGNWPNVEDVKYDQTA